MLSSQQANIDQSVQNEKKKLESIFDDINLTDTINEVFEALKEFEIISNATSQSEEDFTLISINSSEEEKKNPPPIKHRPHHDFENLEDHNSLARSFHDVCKMKKINGKYNHIYFFKRNRQSETEKSTGIQSTLKTIMYQLEAGICELYRVFTPELIPSAHVHLNEKSEEFGVGSKGITGFQSTVEDPLKRSDIVIPALSHFTIEELEKIDEEFALKCKEKNISIENLKEDEVIKYKDIPLNASTMFAYFSMSPTAKVTIKDLKNFRLVRGLAQGITNSYFNEEEDLHRGNMAKDGKRIDFDMSWWEVLYFFKETDLIGGTFNWAFRHPEGRFEIHADDIRHLPNLIHANPFFFPTKPFPLCPETFYRWATKLREYCTNAFSDVYQKLQTNAFTSADNAIYQTLEKNPVFIYYKFATLLKILLLPKNMVRSTLSMHIREDAIDDKTNRKLLDVLADHINHRKEILKQTLLNMPEFQEFFNYHGEHVLENVLKEWQERNNHYSEKAVKNILYEEQIINSKDVKDIFENIKKEFDDKLFDSFTLIQPNRSGYKA